MKRGSIHLTSLKRVQLDEPTVAPFRKVGLLVLRFAIAIAILVWLHKSGALNFHSLTRLIHIWPLSLAAVVILFLDLVFMAIRVSQLFRVQRLSLAFGNALQLTLIGFLFSMVLPGTAGGEIAKFYYAGRENRGKRAEIAASLLFDRLIGLLSLLLLPLLLAPLFLQLIRSVAAVRRILWIDGLLAAGLLLGMIAIMHYQPLRDLFSLWLRKWPNLQGLWNRVAQALLSYRQDRATLLCALILSLLANFAFIVVTAIGLYAISPRSFSMKVFFMAPIGYLINALPLTPGGLGVGEAAFNSLFSLAGMSGGAGALLCVRLWNAIVGLLGLAVYLNGLDRVVHWDRQRTTQETNADARVEVMSEPQFDRG